MKTITKSTMKKLLGGITLALSLAIGIFVGTGMEIRAEGGYTYQPYTLPQAIDWFELYDHCDKIDESEWDAIESWLRTLNISSDTVFIVRISDPNCDSVLVAWSGGDWLRFSGGQRINIIYDSDISGYDKVYTVKRTDVKRTDVACDASESESPIPHTHSYSWVTMQEVTADQDGIEEYRCSCGDVKERCVRSRYMTLVEGLYGAVKDAPQNGTATFDTGSMFTMTDYVLRKLAERSDVTTVVTFKYQSQAYRMTIPAGTDYTGLLTDSDYFYGYFYFASVVGAMMEAL